ncbi:MAG: hypothetical protein HY297_04605 [Thaumarchaeota archaeon]|nr:hypothetical protein [Nitrososphaerota archaeon]
MTSERVERGSQRRLGLVEGDLDVEDGAVVRSADESGVKVTGIAKFEGDAEVDCDLECGSVDSEDGLIRVNRSLRSTGKVEVEDAIYVKNDLKAGELDVGGRASVGGMLASPEVRVGGSLDVAGLFKSDSVKVGGTVSAPGAVALGDMDVGGKAQIGSGKVRGEIKVGGMLVLDSDLEYRSVKVGGLVDIRGRSRGKSIKVGGRLTAMGAMECAEIKAGGEVKIDGDFTGGSIQVGGRVEVTGRLTLTDSLQVGGKVEIGGEMAGKDLEVGGTFKATKAILSGRAAMGRSVETRSGLKAATIKLGKGGKALGPLVGEEVDLEKGTTVEDVYAKVLRVEKASKLGRIFAETVELGDGCSAREIQYTGELRMGKATRVEQAPRKVDALPDPPL